jgi:hypothetical protein
VASADGPRRRRPMRCRPRRKPPPLRYLTVPLQHRRSRLRGGRHILVARSTLYGPAWVDRPRARRGVPARRRDTAGTLTVRFLAIAAGAGHRRPGRAAWAGWPAARAVGVRTLFARAVACPTSRATANGELLASASGRHRGRRGRGGGSRPTAASCSSRGWPAPSASS